ncbi:MAG: replication-associated recombination protein A [Deltaproteobacteria bacterium]|nr:replication-associated recombination protein A [Deltaproteobacteria bacterium]
MSDLFDWQTKNQTSRHSSSQAPLAERLRPKNLDDFVGQQHLIAPGAVLRTLIESDTLPSLILWGPPGSGKTSLGHLIAHTTKRNFEFFSAVLSGIKEARELIEKAKNNFKMFGKSTILFVDEIHRLNKAQQDAFLPHVESGDILMIGATTENPSFEVIAPLLSRSRVFVLKPLEPQDLKKLIQQALHDTETIFGVSKIKLSPEAENFIVDYAQGDARRLLGAVEISVMYAKALGSQAQNKDLVLDEKILSEALQKKTLLYDKKGEDHYNVISAFIKSMRGSDPDAAVYYLARMLEAGEDPLFVARRMVIFASEDVGNADPQAIQVAIAAQQAFHFVGMPEGWIPLAHAATYLASAPKSNASYMAYKFAKADLEKYGALPPPLHLRNAPTKLMKELDYGKGYQYAHDQEGLSPEQQHLPDELKEKVYYLPKEKGYEKVIREYLKSASKKIRFPFSSPL